MLGACRGATPAEGSLATLEVGHSRTQRAPDGGLVHEVRSTADSLQPTARLLRDNASLLLPNNGPMRWSFTGELEEFDPSGDILGAHNPVPHDTTFVRFASSNQLQRDQNRLPDSLTAMLAGSGCAASDFPGGWHGDSICRPPDGNLPGGGGGFIQDSIVSNAVLLQDGLAAGVPTFDLSWDENSPPDQPVLRLDTNFRVRVVRGWLGRVLFRSMRAEVRFAHLVTATPCGPGSATGEPCADNDTTLFSGYRTEALELGADATAPGQALNFGVCSEATETSAHVEIGLRCPLFVNQVLSSVPGWIPGSAWFLCRRAARSIRRSIRSSLCDTAANLEQMMKLAVNPPTFRLTLKDALMAMSPTPDTSGDGVLSDTEMTRALTPLLDGDAFQAAAVTGVADLIQVTLEAHADIHAEGLLPAQTNVLITGDEGSFTDAAIVAFARGSTIRVTGARADLRQVRDACSQGASYGICAGCPDDTSSFCDGPNLVPSVDIGSAAASVDAFDIRPSPHLAKLLSTAPLFADRLRALFARPLPPGAHYIRATSTDATPGVAGGMEGHFEYIVDRDKDGIVDERDNCPETPNVDQANSDADAWGDACDLCPGIDNPRAPGELESGAFGDLDGDGIPNACDCDANGNDCIDHAIGLDGSGNLVTCTIPTGATFENSDARYLGGILEGNFDGDAFLDVCDADLDEDGVLNRDDNCPRGDGDGIWNASVDTNADQTDSGGSALGDLCDPLCTAPAGGLGCGAAGGAAGGWAAQPAGSGIYWRGTPGANECVGQTCTIGSLGFCIGQQADACESFTAIELFTGIGQAEATLTPTALNLDANFGTKVMQTSFDWDGDGQPELLVSSPLASAGGSPYDCPIAQDCVPFNLPEAGSVMVLASTDGHALLRLDGSQAYAHFGQGLALADTTLAVGAPGMASAQTGDGAVYVYDLVNGAAQLRSEIVGQPGDELGQDVSVGERSWPPLFLAGAPGAGGGAGAILAIDTNQGESARFASSVPDARLSRAVMVQRANGGWVVVGGAPSAYAGDGALFFFRDNGRDRVVRGQASEELGASLYANAESLGANRLVVGAPGRDEGAGAIHIYAAGGRRVATRVYWGARVGSALASSGDLDGDGEPELWVAMTVGGERRSVAFAAPSRR